MSGVAITDVAGLEGVIGKTPSPMHLKVIDHLDAGALRWIADSPLMFAGFGDGPAVHVTLAGGARGLVRGDARELRVPVASLDDPARALPGAAFGSLFLIPGIGETLRVNGRVVGIDADHVRVAVDECYGHCAKALIRSELWAAQPVTAPDDAAAFVAASRFLALATVNAQGRADLSPKGDPAGCMVKLDGDILWFADRPGNRRVDSFRNIIEQPHVALALVVPGASRIGIVRGRAQLTADATLRERFTVKDKTPLLAIRVEVEALDLRDSPALARARVWPVHATSDIDPARLFVEHIKLNKVGGVAATLARASLSVPGATGLLRTGLDKDYKSNLY
jgi:predicted pyridoxine 5'-phosphate oxidase superfamily flavin-nucleotide-binding protein